MKIEGDWETREVYLNGRWLDPKPSQRIWNHSPDGFNWGYSGSGPAQLALAILLRICSQNTAIRFYQDFKREIIAALPQDDFEIEIDIEGWVKKHKEEIDMYQNQGSRP